MLLGKDADVIVKSSPVEMENDDQEIPTSQVWNIALCGKISNDYLKLLTYFLKYYFGKQMDLIKYFSYAIFKMCCSQIGDTCNIELKVDVKFGIFNIWPFISLIVFKHSI